MGSIPESRSHRRVRHLTRFALLWAVLIMGRLVHLQVIHHDEYLKRALDQSWSEIEVPAPRGRIVDRTGQTLALSVPADTIVINPRHTPDLSVARDLFVPILNLDTEQLQKRIDWAGSRKSGYLVIKRRVTPEESRRLRSLKLDWIQFQEDSRRSYPKGPLGANVIGTVNFRGEGDSGLELSLNKTLQGTTGVARVLRDARGRAIDTIMDVEPAPGADVGISIDERIQFVADQALARAAEEHGCERGSVVVLDPKSGEVLAMSSYPTFDPNAQVRTAADLMRRVNQAITVPYEPGSVFKIVTLAAALETTDLTPETMIDCGLGVMYFFGRRVKDVHGYGPLPLRLVLAKSSNIGAIQTVYQIGEPRFLEYVKRFGFGVRTGIPLPAESPGNVRGPESWGWTRTSIASMAMGHEISATSLQLALATSVIANGGMLVKPRLVLWRQQPGEEQVEEPLQPARRVLQPETAITMRRMMEGVVLEGTGRRARIEGYSTGGKTGSAQIFDFETKSYTHRYNSSFTGFAPVPDPSVVVTVTLSGADKYGGVVAAPVFQEVTRAALRITGTLPDVPQALPPDEATDEEDFADLAIAALGPPPEGMAKGEDLGQVDIAQLRMENAEPEAEEAALAANSEQPPLVFGPRVPDFHGKTLRAVLETSSSMGFEVEYSGAGLVRAQYPAPGAVLPADGPVVIEFAR